MKHPLVDLAEKQLAEKKQVVHFFHEGTPERDQIEEFLSPLGVYPHAYVLACIMDRQIKAEQAWIIPWKISKLIGGFDIGQLVTIAEKRWIQIFAQVSRHRFKEEMARNFCSAVKRIADCYQGDARRIWNDRPSSAELVYRFLQFDGVGVKIATMATNILARQYAVPLSDRCGIDVSPDVHIMRVFERLGLVEKLKPELVIYKARALNPQYPGVVDYTCWEVGRVYCHKTKPNCIDCPFTFCRKNKKIKEVAPKGDLQG